MGEKQHLLSDVPALKKKGIGFVISERKIDGYIVETTIAGFPKEKIGVVIVNVTWSIFGNIVLEFEGTFSQVGVHNLAPWIIKLSNKSLSYLKDFKFFWVNIVRESWGQVIRQIEVAHS